MTIDYLAVLGPSTLGQLFDRNQLTLDGSMYDMKSSATFYAMPMVVQRQQQIDDIGFYVTSVSGTSALYLVSLRGVDTDGAPNTTNFGGSTGTPVFANQLVEGWNWVTLGISATGSYGDICAPHIQCITGSANNYIGVSSVKLFSSASPRLVTSLGTYRAHPPMAIRYADDTVQGMPLSNMNRLTVGTDPTEYGMRFTVPIDMTCHGMYLVSHAVNTPFRALLFDGEDVIRVTTIADEDQISLGGVEPGAQIFWQPATLTAGQVYRIVAQPTSGASPLFPYELTLVTGSYAYVFPGSDQWQVTYRTNSGSSGFTDSLTKRSWMGVMVSHISTGTSSSETITILSGEGTSAWAY